MTRENEKKKVTFRGDLVSLKKLLTEVNVRGAWAAQPNGVHMLRSPTGANLHWSETSHRVWVDGPREVSELLETEIRSALVRRRTGGLRPLFPQ